MKKILGAILTIVIMAQVSLAAPFNAKAKTKRIPAGTKLELKMLNSLNTGINKQGNGFSAILLTDQTADDDVILPSGSIIRGDIQGISTPKRFSKGAVLYLNFDHVVTPNGRQLPLTLNVVGRTDTRGYADAWKQTCSKSGQITKDAISWAEDITDSGWKYVLVPVSAFGGAFGTAGYFVYGSIADMIKKGKHVQINKDEVLHVILVDPIDVPVI